MTNKDNPPPAPKMTPAEAALYDAAPGPEAVAVIKASATDPEISQKAARAMLMSLEAIEYWLERGERQKAFFIVCQAVDGARLAVAKARG